MTDHEEDDTLERLRQAIAALDGVPAEVREAAKASFTWRTIDAELAELAFDSLLEDAGVRASGEGPRALSFEHGDVVVELEVDDGPASRVSGQVVPAAVASVELDQGTLRRPLEVDALGRFAVVPVPEGPFRVVVRFPPGHDPAAVATEWIAA